MQTTSLNKPNSSSNESRQAVIQAARTLKQGGSEFASPIKLIETELEDYQEPLICAVYGSHGTGKSRFGVTGIGNIGLVALDRKARQTAIDNARSLGKKLIQPNIDLVRSTNPLQAATLPPFCSSRKDKDGDIVQNTRVMQDLTKQIDVMKPQPQCCALHHYRWHVMRTKHVIWQMGEYDGLETILIDSGTNLWNDILFANHGRTDRINPLDRTPDNKEMQEVLDLCQSKHVVITYKEKKLWKNNKETDQTEHDGWKHIGYESGVLLHMTRDPKSGVFNASIEMCQANAALHGDTGENVLQDDLISIPMLGNLIYPENAGYWLR